MGSDNNEDDKNARSTSLPHHNRRTRKSVVDIIDELGPSCIRFACRMDHVSFFDLLAVLKLVNSSAKKRSAENGPVAPEIWLGAALLFFACGRPKDLTPVHNISHAEVFNSIWKVVDTVNIFERLAFSCPSCHKAQRDIVAGFEACSSLGFARCVGASEKAIQGMLP